MKRIHLFEIEDQSWYPSWMRDCLTQLLNVLHSLMNSEKIIADLLVKVIAAHGTKQVIDLCSGGGGPMPGVISLLKTDYNISEAQLTLTDLYPNTIAAEKINENSTVTGINYRLESTDVTQDWSQTAAIRTMICSFHHMPPTAARKILENAQESAQPFFIFELSDNSVPYWIAWISLPINFIMCLFLTLKVRPLTFRQVLFKYLFPIIPISFAWDGAVSNVRTYTLSDVDELLEGLDDEAYYWTKAIVKSKGKHLYLMGQPRR